MDASTIRGCVASWFATYGRIMDKARQIVRPVPNLYQLRMCAAYLWCISNGIAPRIVGFKPRQVGGSTISAAITYHHARNFRTQAVSLADTDEKSNNLFEMISLMAREDRFDWGFIDLPKVTSTEIVLPNASKVIKRSAEAPRGTRGLTLQAALMSEVAYWRDVGPLSADETATAVGNALADHKDTLGIIDTTAKGAAGYAYDTWCGARWPWWQGGEANLFRYAGRYGPSRHEKDDRNDWIRVFAAWWEFPEHTRPVSEATNRDLMASLTEREKSGIARFGWTPEQIAWRRWAIANKCRGDEMRFDEEYPEDVDCMFRASGSPVFDVLGMARIGEQVAAARAEACNLSEGSMPGSCTWSPDSAGWMLQWEAPRVGCHYLLCVDPMTGEETVLGSNNRDRHSVFVIRRSFKDGHVIHRTRVVARIRPPCQVDNGPLARQVALLSRHYGNCPIVVEANMGYGLIALLRDDWNANLWQREEVDRVTSRITRLLGWVTNERTRWIAVDAIRDAVREQNLDLHCQHALAELGTFVRDTTGKPCAASGCHDDDVMALGIGLACLDAATAMPERTAPPSRAPDEERWIEE